MSTAIELLDKVVVRIQWRGFTSFYTAEGILLAICFDAQKQAQWEVRGYAHILPLLAHYAWKEKIVNYKAELHNTNKPIPWVHYYAAHLIKRCGIAQDQVAETIARESDHAFKFKENREVVNYISDNQVIMLTNKWHFKLDQDGHFHVADEWPFVLADAVIDFWLARL